MNYHNNETNRHTRRRGGGGWSAIELAVSFTLCAVLTSCSSDLAKIEHQPSFTVDQAKQYYDMLTDNGSSVRSTGENNNNELSGHHPILPSQFDLDWDDCVTSENSGLIGVEIPMVTENRYRIARLLPNGKEKETYVVDFALKLMIAKMKHIDQMLIYFVALIPDNDYAKKSSKKEMLNDFSYLDNKGNFSGIAITYHIDGTTQRIDSYHKGKLKGGVSFLCEPSLLGERTKQARQLVGPLMLTSSSGVSTRSL